MFLEEGVYHEKCILLGLFTKIVHNMASISGMQGWFNLWTEFL